LVTTQPSGPTTNPLPVDRPARTETLERWRVVAMAIRRASVRVAWAWAWAGSPGKQAIATDPAADRATAAAADRRPRSGRPGWLTGEGGRVVWTANRTPN